MIDQKYYSKCDTFADLLAPYHDFDFNSFFSSLSVSEIARSINASSLTEFDFLRMLSPQAIPQLETMAQIAHPLTCQHFGKVVVLYTPLYLSDYCINRCLYCGFNVENSLQRKKLSLDEVDREGAAIAKSGMQHILILTGESRAKTPVSYIKDCITILRKYFSSISLEIYPLETAEYKELVEAGADGVTIYQEVYNPDCYQRMHPQGPKSDYHFRLATPERAALAGVRTLNIGALLGLDDFRQEAFFTGLHAAFLQQRFPELELSISVPRLRPHLGSFEAAFPVDDVGLTQIILAFRLFLPRVGITLSTRESATLRDNLLPLGVTRMSAGSRTMVGGHSEDKERTGQFDIADTRDEQTMRRVLLSKGYQPVFKDW